MANKLENLVDRSLLADYHDQLMRGVISDKAEKATTLAGYGITDAYIKGETYNKTEVNGLVDTPHQNYVTVQATAQTTDATDVLPASGQSADTIYRVSNWDGDAGAFDVTKYSEYAWDDQSNPNKYVFLCVKTAIGDVFDISVYNNNAEYADLSAALGTNGANVPAEIRRGGMSVKFVCSSDHKYVQSRCMAQNFTTDVTQWQGVDDEPTAGSDNIVKSGGVANSFISLADNLLELNDNDTGVQEIAPDGTFKGQLRSNGIWTNTYETSSFNTNYYQIKKGEILKIYHNSSTDAAKYGFFSQVPSTSVSPDIYVPNTDGTTNDVIMAPIDGYITLMNTYEYNRKCYKLSSVQTCVNSQVESIKNLETLVTSNINFETRVGTYYSPLDNSFYSNDNLNCFIADIQGYEKVSFLVSHLQTQGRGWGILNSNNEVIGYVNNYNVYTEGQKVSVNLDDLDSPKTLIVTYRKTLQSQQYCEGTNNISYPLIEEINRLNELIENKNSGYTFVNISNLTTICHRGRSAISCPSNTVHSITNAYMQGQKYVECDIKFTSDGVPVIMHDTTINAAMQNVDGTPISGDIAIANYTLAELQANYVYKSSVAKYRTPITTLSEWITKVKELSLIPFFHNLPISLLNTVIANFGNNFMYMGRDINTCKAIREAAPSCFIFFQYSTYEDNGTITNIPALIDQMKDIKANAYSSLTYGIFTDEFINALTENGFYWQLSSQSSYEPFAVERGCKFLLSDNWYNDNLSYKSIYRMKDDLSNIDNVTENNGVAVLQNGSTSVLPISSTLGSNIKIAITLSGTANISINNAIKNVGYDNAEKTFIVGRNVIAGDLTISITATSDIKIRVLCVFEA